MRQSDDQSPGMCHQKRLMRSPLLIPAHFVDAGLDWTNAGIDYFYSYCLDGGAAGDGDDSLLLPMRIFCLSHETMGVVVTVVGRK